MVRPLLLCVLIVVVGCSSNRPPRSSAILEKYRSEEHDVSPPVDSIRVFPSPQSSPVNNVREGASNGNGRIPPQTFESDEQQASYIAARLEYAREHYVSALAAQEAGDTLLSAAEFEFAIALLDELSYYPGIESNRDFTDLSQSIIEDYERYIALIDNLDPSASIFALREKLSQVIEDIDISQIEIPSDEITTTAVPLPFNEHVERNILFFLGKGRPHMERWLYLSGKYFPLMKKIFREEGVPEELVILSMPESGLRPEARSWAKAVGLWQFMKGTGQLYGLRGNWWYDERRDFEKATRAAARHLKDLYAEFGDWHVVLAAYNSGAGRVFQAIRRSGSTDYWEMRPYLPRETRNYVPQYIAVARIVLQPERYGFSGIEPADPLAFDVVSIDDAFDLRSLAQSAGTDLETLRELNPELLQMFTPPGFSGYRLRIPAGRTETFLANLASLPKEEIRDWTSHTVRRGETLSSIAQRYGLTASILRDINNVTNDRTLAVGRVLTIPVPRDYGAGGRKVPFEYDREHTPVSFQRARILAERATTADRRQPSSALPRSLRTPSDKQRLVYRVKRGDTIGHIAEWYGVRASDLRNWNNIPYGRHIMVNQELTIWVPPDRHTALALVNEMSFEEKEALRRKEVTVSANRDAGRANDAAQAQAWVQYTVREGDTLERIARMYGVSVSDIKTWNGLRSNTIQVGQLLDIFGEPDVRARVIMSPTPGIQQQQVSQAYRQNNEKVVYHHVKPGETLWSISRMYSVSVKEIEERNDIGGVLRAGDRLVIPVR